MNPTVKQFANWLSRFGEAEILLPVAAAFAVWLFFSTRSLRQLACWLVPLSAAAAAILITKIAFTGWGLGIASLDFRAASGHSMLSAAIFPMLAYAFAPRERSADNNHSRIPVVAAYLFAAAIAGSRVATQEHSWSEVIVGYAMGGSVSLLALLLIGPLPSAPPSRWTVAALAGWFFAMSLYAAPSATLDLVTRIALRISHRPQPFTQQIQAN